MSERCDFCLAYFGAWDNKTTVTDPLNNETAVICDVCMYDDDRIYYNATNNRHEYDK